MAKAVTIKVKLGFLGGYRFLLRRQEEFAHHDDKLVKKKYDPVRAQARRIPRVQDQVRPAVAA